MSFIARECTGDYQLTRGLHRIIQQGGNVDDLDAYLEDRNLPLDPESRRRLAARILAEPPTLGVLTVSNALQWRLQYGHAIKRPDSERSREWMILVSNDEFGDFQTPLPLAAAVLQVLGRGPWARVLEPTCGTGNFLRAAKMLLESEERVGIELQPHYVREARHHGRVIAGDIFPDGSGA